ncbi:hypothetical protein [Glycomyces buryatensis]|uniref:Uncharacterized protein n=1 Tax=Glycomyces buryatensis TaxID=2570927 RepID=A0A4S8QAL6_9ACTN|nr:hypothetical protein [Glycomyces buryatensis]THV41310.1 hypothetical protein FAB82_12150 [Glycomyces buryatensis]
MGIRTRCDPAIELIEQVPGLPQALIEQATGQQLPEHDEVQVEEIWEYTFYTRGVDSLLLLRKEGEPVLAVILRMVHDRLEDHRTWFWPYLVPWVRASYGCPTIMVAIAESPDLAEWARQPIDWGVGGVAMRPVAVCLGEIESGDDVGLGLLFALSDRASTTDLERAAEGLASLPFEQAQQFAGLVDIGKRGDLTEWRRLTESAGYVRDTQDLRWTRFKVYEADKLRSMARCVLRVLTVKGFEPSDRVRTRILTTESERQADDWLGQAANAEDLAQHFSDEALFPFPLKGRDRHAPR